MRLSTKSRYAVTSLLDLVLHSEQGPVSLADISERQGISLSYLEQLFAKMRRNKLVNSTRGPGGGYTLSRSPEDVCVAEIIHSVDEKMKYFNKDAVPGCEETDPCLTEQLWQEFSEQISNYLTGITLSDMMSRAEILEVSLGRDNASTSR